MMKTTQKIYENGIVKARPTNVLFENFLIFLNLAAAFVGMFPIQVSGIPVLSIAYLAFAITMLTFVLRKHLCTQCYYYGKTCHCGWGKYAEKVYKKGSGNQKLGGKMAAITWIVVSALPILSITILIFIDFSFVGIVCLGLCVFIAVINGVLHVKDCKECKMRYCCPGSAYKERLNKNITS